MPDFVMKNICKSFPGVKALDNANFNANRGDIVALLGENGAGKSTLIKVLCGEHKPDSGEIFFEGRKLSIHSTRDAIEQKICAVYQELSLVPELTIAENMFLGFYEVDGLRRVNYRKLEERTAELFKKYDADYLNPGMKVKELSLAQKQVLEILKALNRDGDIIVFDEATSALSDKNARWLMNIIRRLAEEGKVIIFISHRLDEIRSLCSRVIVYRAGTDVADLKIEEADSDQLVALMLGREIGGYYPEKENFVREDEVLVSLKNVCSGHALRNVNLDLRAGEPLTLVCRGPALSMDKVYLRAGAMRGGGRLAGQGQSELFKCLFGLLPYSGEIAIKGKVIRMNNTATAMKQSIALIPEERGLQGVVLKQSVRENIVLASLDKIANGLFLSKAKESAVVDESMKALSVKAESPETLVGTLSGGNQQKVVLAKALATEPDIILMYDITRGVDVGTKKEMFNMTKQYAKEGKAILFYSTDSEELVNVCGSVVVMNGGMIAGRLDGDMSTRENIIRLSVGEDAKEENDDEN